MRKDGDPRAGRRIRFDAGVCAGFDAGLYAGIYAGYDAGIVGPVASCAGLAVYNDLGRLGLVLGHSAKGGAIVIGS